jgi:feruloyl esterase
VRTFVVPGMNHCAGGPATDRFDALSAIVDWVEKYKPPQRIEARGSAVLHDETRPLCPWPQVARYSGQGRLNDSSSFECR